MLNNCLSIFYIILGILIGGCANVQTPTGGPRDKQGPEIEKTSPENASINYKGSSITFTFNENIQDNQLTEKMIVSPSLKNEPKINIKKNQLTIDFKETLAENTTYTIHLNEGVKDITEGNPVNQTLLFSTGNYIDSLSINGTVLDLFTNQNQKNIIVSLYTAKDTLHIQNAKPLYFTKTDLFGNFQLQNLKEGTYHLYALEDQNKNLIYDLEKEKIAFYKNIKIPEESEQYKLYLSKIDTIKPFINYEKEDETLYKIVFNENIKSALVIYQTDTLITKINQKELVIYNTGYPNNDSIPVNIVAIDSSFNTTYLKQKIKFGKHSNELIIPIGLESPKDYTIKPDQKKIAFYTNRPINEINKELIKIKSDTNELKEKDYNIYLNKNKLGFSIQLLTQTKDSLKVKLAKGLLTGFYSDSSLQTEYSFRIAKEEETGLISGKINTSITNYIFEFLDSKNDILFSEYNTKSFHFKYLQPGEYKLRVKIDEDGNGHWDNADLNKNKAAEPIINYKENINLRANWEMLDINFSF